VLAESAPLEFISHAAVSVNEAPAPTNCWYLVPSLTVMVWLAAGLLAAPEPQAEPQKGWVVEIRGFTMHSQPKPKARFIIEFQWPAPKAAPKVEPVVIETVEAFYVDDVRAFLERTKKKP